KAAQHRLVSLQKRAPSPVLETRGRQRKRPLTTRERVPSPAQSTPARSRRRTHRSILTEEPPRGDGRKVRPFSSQLRSRRGDHVVDRHVLAVRDTSTASPSPFVSAQCYPSSATSQPAMLMDDRCQLDSCSTFAIATRKRSV